MRVLIEIESTGNGSDHVFFNWQCLQKLIGFTLQHHMHVNN